MTDRRRFLAGTLALVLGPSVSGAVSPGRANPGPGAGPFDPCRSFVLPEGPSRRHRAARRAIRARVEELAADGLWRLPGPKVEALLRAAVTLADHYGPCEPAEKWAARIPVAEAFTPHSAGSLGVLAPCQPLRPAPGAAAPVEWWLFLSPAPIDWGSLDGRPVHAVIAHVARDGPVAGSEALRRAQCSAWSLAGLVERSPAGWPGLARLAPRRAVRRLNAMWARIPEEGR